MSVIIPGYKIGEKIHETPLTSVYNAVRENDETKVIIKTLNSEYPNNQDLAKLRLEYQIAEKLKGIKGVIQVYSLEQYTHGNLAIVMEPFGQSFAVYIKQEHRISVDNFFKFATKITQILGGIHQGNVIHKDINPRNILFRNESDDIRVIDFGISSELSMERQDINVSKRLEGSLPYISPEQTGRMNRDLDYRSDYYSLGVTFYELLTGILPFYAEDILGWVHCHISKPPSAPHQINENIPAILAKIILKLISKNAEERYQSAYGLIEDLKRCQKQMTERGIIDDFPIGEVDISAIFQIPQKMYGRKKELTTLLKAFAEVADGKTELIMVSGYSGVGKSALVNELQKQIVHAKGYFIEGKFDQFGRNIPYSAISQAFHNLTHQLMAEPIGRQKTWKNAFLQAFGPNGQIILDIVPDLEKIIGPQPPVAELPPNKAQSRFRIVFHQFIKVLANADHPLIIFLDDLQWSDASTLNLLQKLVVAEDLTHLLFIGAYRSNEVDAGHPLHLTLAEIQKTKDIHNLFMQSLDELSVNSIVADTLHRNPVSTHDLGELLHKKTEGNPFFVGELLKNLYHDGAIKFSTEAGKWTWNMESIQQVAISGNVVEFMIASMRKLSSAAQTVLQLAACIGNTFDLNILSIIYEHSMEETNDKLMEVLKKGMIVPLDDKYKFISVQFPISQRGGDGDLQVISSKETKASAPPPDFLEAGSVLNPRYRFQHDRVQQAAYALIDVDKKREAHLSIGCLIQRQTKQTDLEKNLVDIVRHLNIGKQLIGDPRKKEELSRLNLKAGIKAKNSTAYQPALEYLKTGLELLLENPWKNQYELIFNLNMEYVQCAYLTGKFDEAEERIEIMLSNVKTLLEKAEIISVRSYQCGISGKLEESIRAGLHGLSLLGMKLPYQLSKLPILVEIVLAKWNLGKKPILDIVNARELTDPKKTVTVKLLMEMGMPTYTTGNKNLVALLSLKALNIFLRYGNSPESAFAYVTYGLILGGVFGDLKTGYEFGKLGIAVNERFDDIKFKSRVVYVYNLFVHHWNNHWSTLTPLFKKGMEAGYQSGDVMYLALNALQCVFWNPTLDLESLCKEQEKYHPIIKESGYLDAVDLANLHQQTYRNYLGLTNELFSLNDASFDELQCFEAMRQRNFLSGIFIYHLFKAEICFLHDGYSQAFSHIEEASKEHQAIKGTPYMVRFCFVTLLSFAACYPKTDTREKRRFDKRIKQEYKRMTKWANHFPVNFKHLHMIMRAEIARLAGEFQAAARYYDQAIKAANKNAFLRDEAMANELAAKFYLEQGQESAAVGYLREAHYLYYRWGGKRKIEHLEKTYPQSRARAMERVQANTATATTTTAISTTTTSEPEAATTLDFASAMKASQAISGEIVPETLLKKMISVVIENAGAQAGSLLLQDQGQWQIKAQGSVDQGDSVVLQVVLIESDTIKQLPLSAAIIQYVEMTKESLVLDDAAHEGRFTQDPYIIANQPKSVLCAPILHHNKLIGIIYLENNLITGAFTPDRLEVLNLLSSQTAISLENASLYANLEEKVKQRTAELEAAHHQMAQAHHELGKKNDETRKSLVVASGLQFSLLPKLEVLQKAFDQHFVIWQPRDIVGGDIYFCFPTPNGCLLAVIDCTGHGVPGAFVTMIAGSGFESMMNDKYLNDPGTMLTVLNLFVTRTLHQGLQDATSDNGMDMGLCCIDRKQGTITYAGAKFSLIVIDREEIQEINGDRKSIGYKKADLEYKFTNHVLDISPSAAYYLHTDGIVDQAGGKKRFPFGKRRFNRLLLENQSEPLAEQREILLEALEEYQGDQMRRDDVIVVGFGFSHR